MLTPIATPAHDLTVAAPIAGSESSLSVRVQPLDAVSDEFKHEWRELLSRSVEDNAFLAPAFVLPALKLDSSSRPFALAVESPDGRLRGLAVLEETGGTRLLPLKHLRSWRTDFTFFDGLLLDREHAAGAADAVFSWLRDQPRWHGLAFENRSHDSAISAVLSAAAEAHGLAWVEDDAVNRAALDIGQIPADPLTELFSKSRRKSLRHSKRRLAKLGDVSFRMRNQPAEVEECVETFLRLEAMGWKGDEGTAMKCDPVQTGFCREFVQEFAETSDCVFFELSVSGEPAAITLNLLCRETMFAVKVAWHTDYAQCSPGRLCDFETLVEIQKWFPEVRLVDGCAQPGSYIEELWPWRRPLTSGVFPTTGLGQLATRSMRGLKSLNRLLRSR